MLGANISSRASLCGFGLLDDTESKTEILQKAIADLHIAHGQLDNLITQEYSKQHPDFSVLQRLKREKLQLKDEMARLHEALLPDLIA
ncbi:MAG: YdcH family protein [Pseudomonadota bacterium]